MLRKLSHSEGVQDEELLFSTGFDYLNPEAARSPLCLLPAAESTVEALKELGERMADPGPPESAAAASESSIPAAFTYFGQFIDHDITAQADRGTGARALGSALARPRSPELVVRELRNARRPSLDLESVFGDGPGLSGSAAAALTQSSDLYDAQLRLHCFEKGPGRYDLPREAGHVAVIADVRNDENVVLSQLHTSILKFYNAVLEGQLGSREQRYVRARQLVRWAYQVVVVNDYLPSICDPAIVLDALANGPRFLGPPAGRSHAFLPLEFSAAAFRFGHAMIRPSYVLNSTSSELLIRDLLDTSGNPANFESDGHLASTRIVDWRRFAGDGPRVQRSRRIDPRLARGLFPLPFRDRAGDRVLAHLAQSNLMRGYSLGLPTAQALCDGYGILPLTPTELRGGEDEPIAELLDRSGFDARTPLWYYVLREAAVQQNGQRLGELGSRLVAETLIGLLKQDPNSYLHNLADPAVHPDRIDVRPRLGDGVRCLTDLLDIAGVADF